MVYKVKYRILNSSDYKELENGVNYLLEQGWELHEGLNVKTWRLNESDYFEFYQAMVKDEKKISCKCGKQQKAF